MKSPIKNVVSGSIASWVRIGLNLMAQLIVTPFYLKNWSIEEYGIWISFLTGISFLQIFDLGFQNYVGNSFLILGKEKTHKISKLLFSSIPFGGAIALIQIGIVLIIINTDVMSFLNVNHLKKSNTSEVLNDLFLIEVIIWGITGSIGGLFIRYINVYGYYSRFSWWGTYMQLGVIIAPVCAVFFGAGVRVAGISMLLCIVIVNIFMFYDLFKIFKT